jgi:hypothetical protein
MAGIIAGTQPGPRVFAKLSRLGQTAGNPGRGGPQAAAIAEQEYDRFAARRRTHLEDNAQADTLKQLEDELKKLPATKKPKSPKP